MSWEYLIYKIIKYIKYFKDLIKSNLPPPNFTEIAKLIDVCIKFSLDNLLYHDTFLRSCYRKWYWGIDGLNQYKFDSESENPEFEF